MDPKAVVQSSHVHYIVSVLPDVYEDIQSLTETRLCKRKCVIEI